MKREDGVLVCQDDINRQREFIHLIRETNAGELKKYKISTFGCQMNEHDSERLAGMLAEMGYIETDKTSECDLIIFNTCCVRENAELKVYGHLGGLKKYKREKPGLTIAVCGCMMQQKNVVEHIRRTYRHVDLVFGTHNLFKFPELLHTSFMSRENVYEVWENEGIIAEGVPVERKDGIKAWVTIMYGCNNFCSYCIVPYVRGRERSRSPGDIINEVRMLGQQGYKEITLLGQNVNSYGKDMKESFGFSQLLYSINELEGIERVRFMTSHPKDLSDDLIKAMRDCNKVSEHLHLPVQAGSTRILSKMNRRYSKEQYLELVQKIKDSIPGIALTTDIIVGFPGETEEDFAETLDILEKVRFDSAYTFLYSKRTGTPAASETEQISEDVKKERFERLLNIQNTISREINDLLVGKVMEVLVEGPSKNNINVLTGRTMTNKIVNFKAGKELKGRLAKVEITNSFTWSLEGIVRGVV